MKTTYFQCLYEDKPMRFRINCTITSARNGNGIRPNNGPSQVGEWAKEDAREVK